MSLTCRLHRCDGMSRSSLPPKMPSGSWPTDIALCIAQIMADRCVEYRPASVIESISLNT